MQSRQKVKRQLLDQLDELHSFELPPKMVEQEFDNIWRQIVGDMSQSGRTFEAEGTTEEATRGRLSEDRRAPRAARPRPLRDRREEQDRGERGRGAAGARRPAPAVPGPGEAAPRLLPVQSGRAWRASRAPVFEEKVVDLLLELVKVTDKPVSREELMREDETEDARQGQPYRRLAQGSPPGRQGELRLGLYSVKFSGSA